MLALGSKAAMIAKSGGGLSGLAKGAGLLAVGGVDIVMLLFPPRLHWLWSGSKSCSHHEACCCPLHYRRSGSCCKLEAWK